MVQELSIYIDFHTRPFAIEISDFETPVHAIFICNDITDLKSALPLSLDYYKKLYNKYLIDKKNGKQNSKTYKQQTRG